MATPIRDAMINNSSKDGTGDAIEGSEVDANPNTLADLLDGTSTTVWGQAGQVSFESWGIKEDAAAAGSIKDKWVYEWDPSDGSNLTDNSSGLGMVWKMPDDADNQTEFANLDIMCNDDAASSEDAEFVFSTVINATMREVFSVGSQGTTFNEDSQDLDFRIETDNIANGFIADAGLDVFSFGAAAADDKFVTISPPAATHTATNDTYALHVTAGGAQTIPSGTTALVASLAVEEPNITATGTVTNAATVYIKNAPTEGGTGNYALWIDAGASQLDGTLTVGVNDTGHDVKFFGATSGQYLLWDESADELVLAGDTKLSFHDAAGGENIIASADGHLEINAGTTLDITATTIDLNGAVAMDGAITGGTNITISGELDAATLDISGNADIAGDLTLSAGADGALTFANAGENSIKIPDNQASALIVEEANNAYLTFVTTNSGEKITLGKKLEAGSVEIEGSAFDINGGNIDGTIIGAASAAAGSFAAIVGTSLSVSDGNITNVGDIALDSISSDAGTSINVVLGSDAGDDFTVDTNKLVVEGDTGNIGIATASPDAEIHLTGAPSTGPTLKLENTSTNASGSYLEFYKNTSAGNIADGDGIGNLYFYGNNDAGTPEKILYTRIEAWLDDFTDGTEDGTIDIATSTAGTIRSKLRAGPTEVVVNEHSIDVDFRVESDGNANAFFVQGSDSAIGIGTGAPDGSVHLKRTSGNSTVRLETTDDADTDLVFVTGSSGVARIGVDFSHAKSLKLNASGSLADLHLVVGTGGNVGIGTSTWGTNSVNVLSIKNGTIPASSPADSIQLYAEDASSSSELKVRDEAGNVTTLSPHNFGDGEPSEEMAWSYHSKRGGKSITVDMLRVVRLLEKLTGEKLAHIEEAA